MTPRVAVVGGGILGLAAGRLLASEHGADVVLLEKEPGVARHQTGRNSGVVHAGLYYPPGSSKARLCRRGGTLLRALCAEHGLTYDACGKVVVALRDDELPRLDALHERATANGVPDLALLDAAGLRGIEPEAAGIAALHSPHTAIVDYGAVSRALAEGLLAAGGQLRLGTAVEAVDPAGPRVRLAGGEVVRADRLLVCAGLQADRLARAAGEPDAPRIVPFRGEYWRLSPGREALVRGLICPVPDPALPFLGVHLTRRVDGSVLVGPNAVPTLAREGYRWRDFDARDARDAFAWPGMLRLARRHWRFGAREIAGSLSRTLLVRDGRRYVPALERQDLVRAPAGVRAQAVDRDGTLVDDFRISDAGDVVWVRNAPSPGATSALAIAEELVARLRLTPVRRPW